MKPERWALVNILFVLACACFGCDAGTKRAPSGPPLPAEPWASKPPGEWPQLVLTNHAEFKGHTTLRGASAFLVKGPDGRTLAATARHLIGQQGGVEPEISLPELDGAIRIWGMFPRTQPKRFVLADKLACSGLDDKRLDWLLLTVKETDKEPPATPLRLRPDPVQVGERICLIGCPYEEQGCQQNVYHGTVNARRRDRFRYDLDRPVNVRGFSGAPIVDQRGHAVGVMTVWFSPKMKGDQYLEAGGEDATSVYSLIDGPRPASREKE